jgi:hypothetical protein
MKITAVICFNPADVLAAKLLDCGLGDFSGIVSAISSDLDDLAGDDVADRVVAIYQVKRIQG